MSVSASKLPLSAVYLNLLQSRPVGATAPVARGAAPTVAAATQADAADRPAAAIGRSLGRGRLIDILA